MNSRPRWSCAKGWCRAPASSDSGLSPAGRRILEAIEGLPEGEREAFDLVKIQGLTYAEAAEVLGVSLRTVKRWVSRACPAAGWPTWAWATSAGASLSSGTTNISPAIPSEAEPCPTTRAWNSCSTNSATRGATPEDVCGSCPELLPWSAAAGGSCAASRPRSMRSSPVHPSRTRAARRPHTTTTALPRIPGYEVEAVLGRGGMGVVYKARHPRLNRAVALKMLLAGPYAGPEELERFLREAETVAGLRHANIVQVHEAGDVDGRPYFTMEFVEGGSLAQKAGGHAATGSSGRRPGGGGGRGRPRRAPARHRPPRPQAGQHPADRRWHAQGDRLRPGPAPGRRRRASPQSGALLGTPSYMAPEQAEGRSRDVGPAADVYALGAILYECLTGRPPFRAETAADTRAAGDGLRTRCRPRG